MNKNYFKLLLFIALVYPPVFFLLGTEILFPNGSGPGFLHFFYYAVTVVGYVISIGMLSSCTWQPQAVDFADVDNNSKPPKKYVVGIIAILLLILGSVVYKKSVFINNASISYVNAFEQKTQEKPGAYDELWKTSKQMLGLADTAKNAFIDVVRIQYNARVDGQAVTWKWVHENTNVDHEQFLKFYSNLSDFIRDKRAEYRQLEKEALTISKQHNLLIDTFPNNIYNSIILHRPHLTYKYGLLSDSTNQVFSTGVENLK